MTDQQVQAPEQQVPSAQQVQPQSGDWEIRYKGQQAALQRLAEERKAIDSQLAAKTSELEQLRAQLELKQVESTVALGERDKNLQTLVQNNQSMQARLAELEALSLKIEVAKKLKRPEILPLLDRIPNITDEAVLTQYVNDFIGWADDLVKKREQELLSGVTPPVSPGAASPTTPSSPSAWQEYIERLPLGTSERAKAMNEYGDWLEKNMNSR